MAVTKRADTVIPEVLEEAVRGAFAGAQALYGTGAALVQTRGWPDARGGDRIKIPYFGNIGAFEDLAANEGGSGPVPALTPAKITMDADTALVKHSGKAVEITQWAQYAASYADPYGEMARQILVELQRKADAELLTEALTTTLSHNIYNADDEVGANLTWEELLRARYKWGDEQGDIAAMVVHSETALRLLLQKDDFGRPIYEQASLSTGNLPTLAGIPVIVSDRMPYEPEDTDAAKATSLLVKRGALAWWFNGDTPSIQTDVDILSDTDVAALHVYYATHLYRRPAGGSKLGVVKVIHNLNAVEPEPEPG